MAAPRRILHVLNYGYPAIDGYVARSVGLLTAQQEELGYEVTAATSPFAPLTWARDPELVTGAWGPHNQIPATTYQADGQPRRVGKWERPQLGLARRSGAVFRRELASIARRVKPEVIHAHHPHYIAAAARAVAEELGLPMVYELRCFNGDYDLAARNPYFLARGRYQNALELRAARAADAVVTISQGLAERVTAGGVAPERVHVVRNSVNTAVFTPRQPPPSTWTADRGELHIGYATTFEAMEGLDILVRAAGEAHAELAERGVRLRVTLAGTGRQWDAIRSLIDELNLEPVVDLPGLVPYSQMPELYRSMDLFIVPRRRVAVASDTTPLKPLEALACGLPMLASDLPAMRELLERRDDARFVPPGDPEALARAIADFAKAPWPGLGGVEQRSWAREVQRYPAIYDQAQHRAAARAGSAGGVPIGPDRPGPLRRLGKTALRRAVDRGLPGTRRLEKHVVVCGFPRTGSTLLQVMVEACVAEVLSFAGEVEGLWAARHANRNHRFMLTKLPADIDQAPAIRAHYARHPGRPLFVLMLRDPRAVLTSRHKAYPQSRGYYVSPERWRAIYERFGGLRDDPDTLVLRYEDLVGDPATAQRRLTEAVGWRVDRPFAEFDQRPGERDSMTEGALGGVRPVETSRVESWRRPEHRERLAEVLAALPELPAALIELGYESDQSWARPYLEAGAKS